MLGNMFFGWNCLAPWFSYPRRTALRRKFNLEVSPYSFFYFNMLFILLMPYWMESLCFILVHCLALFFLGSCSCGSSTLSFLFCFCVVCINQKWHSLVVFCCDMLFMKIEIICFYFYNFIMRLWIWYLSEARKSVRFYILWDSRVLEVAWFLSGGIVFKIVPWRNLPIIIACIWEVCLGTCYALEFWCISQAVPWVPFQLLFNFIRFMFLSSFSNLVVVVGIKDLLVMI